MQDAFGFGDAPHLLRSILVCDDRQGVARAVDRRMLRAPGQLMRWVPDGSGMLEAIACGRPDVVLIGVRRDQQRSASALDLLLTVHPSIPAVVFGAHTDSRLLAAAVATGALGVLVWDPREAPVPHSPWSCPNEHDKESGLPAALTDREQEVLVGMSLGLSNSQIGRNMFVSEDTVKTHVRKVYSKLHVRDRAHAVANALRSGILT